MLKIQENGITEYYKGFVEALQTQFLKFMLSYIV